MAEDWLADVRKYAAHADEAVVAAIVRYCGIALQKRDSALVAFSDKKETDLVRENFLKKKLGLTDADPVLDEAIAGVGQVMKADRTKNRVTVYYLLAEHFGLLTLFGGAAGDASSKVVPLAAAAGLAGAAGLGAAEAAQAPSIEPVQEASEPLAANTTPAAAYSTYDDDNSGGGLGWLKWLLLAALLLALLFFALRYCTPHAEQAVTADTPATEATTSAAASTEPATATAAAAIPTGAGVVAADRAGKPMLTVYFDTGKSEVSNDLSAAAANVKDYLAKNAGAKLAVSGFNDPTGNAAINAELSKKRAQGVKAALEKLGIAPDSVELVKPADTTDTSTDSTAARRVEVTIK